MRFRFTRSSRRHRIGRAHTRAAMTNAVLVEIREQSWGYMGIFVGTDDRGVELEIGVIGADEDPELWIIAHVMPPQVPVTKGTTVAHKPEPEIIDEDLDLDAEVIHVNGQRLTEELADQIADEAARTGRDRSNANLIPGRKSLSGGAKHSPVVNVRVSDETRAALGDHAEQLGESVSKVSRGALDGEVAYYVCFEQSFDGAGFERVRIDQALPIELARESFEHYRRIATSFGFRSVEIRRGRDEIVARWPPQSTHA